MQKTPKDKFIQSWSDSTLSLKEIAELYSLTEMECQFKADQLRRQGIPMARRRR